MSPDEAQELFDGLVGVLLEAGDERLSLLVREVEETIARGRPAAVEVRVSARRARERVRRVESLSAVERLDTLVRAIELTLVAPSDLLAATFDSLRQGIDGEFELVFESDSADADAARPRRLVGAVDQQSAGGPAVVAIRDVERARTALQPLRQALAAIRTELES